MNARRWVGKHNPTYCDCKSIFLPRSFASLRMTNGMKSCWVILVILTTAGWIAKHTRRSENLALRIYNAG